MRVRGSLACLSSESRVLVLHYMPSLQVKKSHERRATALGEVRPVLLRPTAQEPSLQPYHQVCTVFGQQARSNDAGHSAWRDARASREVEHALGRRLGRARGRRCLAHAARGGLRVRRGAGTNWGALSGLVVRLQMPRRPSRGASARRSAFRRKGRPSLGPKGRGSARSAALPRRPHEEASSRCSRAAPRHRGGGARHVAHVLSRRFTAG